MKHPLTILRIDLEQEETIYFESGSPFLLCTSQALDAGTQTTLPPSLSAQATVGPVINVEEKGLNSLPRDWE